MQLHTLLKLIKNNFVVDEELRAYIYKNRIEFIDFTSAIIQDGKQIMDDFYGLMFILYYDKDNTITSIEPTSLNLITSGNANMYKFLADLIGQQIGDLNSYPVVPDLDEQIYQTC